jgi:hypothetical protein
MAPYGREQSEVEWSGRCAGMPSSPCARSHSPWVRARGAHALQYAAVSLLRAECAGEPLAVAFDTAAESSVSLLTCVARRLRAGAPVYKGCYRDEAKPPRRALPLVQDIQSNMTVAMCQELCRSRGGDSNARRRCVR